jgi:hypothetical protein
MSILEESKVDFPSGVDYIVLLTLKHFDASIDKVISNRGFSIGFWLFIYSYKILDPL